MPDRDDVYWMERALECARLGEYGAAPNPMVGAVALDREGVMIGEGYHRAFGTPHAEVEALAEAGDAIQGGTLYVTLEPCAHHGKTPPCVDAVIAAGVARVVIALRDPNPIASGGIDRLHEAGIEVETDVCNTAARQLNRRWLKYVTQKTPWVTIKAGVSLDGRIATAGGESQWITSEEARRHGRTLRESHDAIMVGIGTVLADDPQLTRRMGLNPRTDLVRIILDSTLKTPIESRIVREDPHLTLIAHTENAPASQRNMLAARKVELIEIAADDNGQVDIAALLSVLATRQISAVLVEGGSGIHGSIIDHDLADEAYFYVAPIIIGGPAPAAVGGAGIQRLADAPRFHFDGCDTLDGDILLRAERLRKT